MENGSKSPMHTNENMAIGLFKEAMLKLFLEPEEKRRLNKLEELQGKWNVMFCHRMINGNQGAMHK